MPILAELNKATLQQWLEQSITKLEKFERDFPAGSSLLPNKWDAEKYEVRGIMQVLDLCEKVGIVTQDKVVAAQHSYSLTFTDHTLNFFAGRTEYKKILQDILNQL